MKENQFARYLASFDAVRITINGHGLVLSEWPIATRAEKLFPDTSVLPTLAECGE